MPSPADPTPQSINNVGLTRISEQKIKLHIANGHTKTLGFKPEPSRARSHEEAKNRDHVRKDKDPKSFTQNLFDTVAMKLLHRASASDIPPPWAPSNEKAQLLGSSELDSKNLEPKTEGSTSKNAEEEAEWPVIPDIKAAQAAHRRDVPQVESVSDVASVEGNITPYEVVSGRVMFRESAKLERELEKPETSGNEEKEHDAANIKAKELPTGTAAIPLKLSQPGPQSEKSGPAGVKSMRKISVSVASPCEPKPDRPARSLSHFTSENIKALEEKVARYGRLSGPYEQHYLLKCLGRTDLPLRSSECGRYGDFLAYSGQSMTYVLSNVDALLRSFLHFDDNNASSHVVWSYDFLSMVDLFQKLQYIDMHPQKIFPSLWVSAGRLYPVSTATNKRRSLTASDPGLFSLDPPPASQGSSLEDLEACHVVKIILAALVASVPNCSPMSWLAVRKLHASGQVAPFIDADNSPAEQKMIAKLVRTLHAFENEMALSLVIRLTRSIDIRYHRARASALAEDAKNFRREFPPTFANVIDYVNHSLKIRVADNKSHSSVEMGDHVEPITWHRKFWPIIIEWLRAVIVKEWDGNATIAKGSAVGGALGLLVHLRKQGIFSFSFVC